jgi:hypothetical protein
MISANGSTYKKLDLHIHTPRSQCYSDMSVRPEQIVEAAVVFGLDGIAVTDHNCVEAVDDMRRAAARESLVVFPGMELTTRSGHFLAIFDLDAPVERLRALLDAVGVAREHWGDGAEMVGCETEEVLRHVVEAGGLAIAAHIERWPSGFLETKEPRSVKMAIHASRYLSALEITVAQNREQWQSGTVRGYPRRHACVQGSDAHAPTEVGRRPFLLRTETLDLAALRAAFADWETRIAFPDDLEA